MKIASIDIGTNTVILLIAEIRQNKIFTIRNEYKVPRIGAGINRNKYISDEKISELIRVLSDFKEIIKSYNCDVVLAIATNAFRIALNAPEIISLIRDTPGIRINVASSIKEAEYSFLGAISDYNGNEDNVVIDIGGGSTEIISGRKDNIKYINSFQIGVVTGTELFFKHDPPLASEVNNFEVFLDSTFVNLSISGFSRAIAIAGTPTTLICIKKGLNHYNEDEVDGSKLKRVDILKLKDEVSHLSSKQIKEKYTQVVSGREDVLFAGTFILYKLMTILKLDEIIVSTKGIRYGVIKEYMASIDKKSI
jgi:exopolyphosphatase / guanosine-5'-triphosphate,3'-diphosphate pyrophosphatase